MHYLRDVDFWLRAGPTLAALIVPLLTYLWLARRMARYQSRLSKDIEVYKTVLCIELERYKADISNELESHKSQLQSAFQVRFYELQPRRSWLYQRRAEAIEKLYALLAKVENDLRTWVTSSHNSHDQTEDELFRTAEDHFQELGDLFDERRIYFDQGTIEAVLVIVQATRVIYDRHSDVQRTMGSVPELAALLKQNAAALLDRNISPLMGRLEERFRKLLEVEAPIPAVERPDGGPQLKDKGDT